MEKLYEKLKQYSTTDYYPYHMPGHKRRMFGELPGEIIETDITEIAGFDNLHQSEGILLELQKKAACLYGAEESFYLINGSSGGILSAISAALPMGGHILMARNCHKSAYHAAYLRNLTVSYLYPAVISEYDICDAITPKQVELALEQEPDIQAVFLVSPTYEGRIADIRQIAGVVHAKGIPLIVDEAHGAHLGWADVVSHNSCQLGADIVIHSVHKTLPAMTQTALLHVCGNRVDREVLQRFLHIYQSSSPSYVLMASIDNALNVMEKDGGKLLQSFSENYAQMLDTLSGCRNLDFLKPEKGKQDLGKLVISGKRFGLSGQAIYDILLERYHLQLEMAAGSYCLAMFTVGDDKEAYERMTQALCDMDKRMTEGEIKPDVELSKKVLFVEEPVEETLPIYKAWDQKSEWISILESTGRYLAEFVNLYPPGVPLLVPGEKMTSHKKQVITSYLEQHLPVQGVEKHNDINMVKVLEEEKKA